MIAFEPIAIEARLGLVPRGLPDSALARLARLIVSNDRLQDGLRRIDDQAASARAYLAVDPPNRAIAEALIARLTDARSAMLAHLRANREAAREFIAA